MAGDIFIFRAYLKEQIKMPVFLAKILDVLVVI